MDNCFSNKCNVTRTLSMLPPSNQSYYFTLKPYSRQPTSMQCILDLRNNIIPVSLSRTSTAFISIYQSDKPAESKHYCYSFKEEFQTRW